MLKRSLDFYHSKGATHEEDAARYRSRISRLLPRRLAPRWRRTTPKGASSAQHIHRLTSGLFSETSSRGSRRPVASRRFRAAIDYATLGRLCRDLGSNVSWLQDFKVYERSSVEIDVYGGMQAELRLERLRLDIGTIYYCFPGNKYPRGSAPATQRLGVLRRPAAGSGLASGTPTSVTITSACPNANCGTRWALNPDFLAGLLPIGDTGTRCWRTTACSKSRTTVNAASLRLHRRTTTDSSATHYKSARRRRRASSSVPRHRHRRQATVTTVATSIPSDEKVRDTGDRPSSCR